MQQTATNVQVKGTGEGVRATTPVPTPTITVWGLCVRELHDAYWHARGVQPVRRGMKQTLQPGSEVFMLVEPGQLALFNIMELADRLTWHDAAVTRVRLVEPQEQAYSERVVKAADGVVERIERIYRPAARGSSRVMLTSSRRLAQVWAAAKNRHEGWDKVRRSVPWDRVDHWKCAGRTFLEGNEAHERELLDELVERWATPNQAIDGLVSTEEGVWRLEGEPAAEGAVRIGPMWLGCGSHLDRRRCLVGPMWIADRPEAKLTGETSAVRVRPIEEIELADPTRMGEDPAIHHYQVFKRCIDVVGSALALLALLPVMVVIAICILREDGRPLFFGHERQGRGGKVFKCWKFRTMVRNAHEMVEQFKDANMCDGPQVNIEDDPRVTRVGRFLRRWHLDELPQFWNVLRGHMSLVGPRPSPDKENQYCPAWRDTRLSVRPGITGLWQLNRTRERGEDFQEWIKYDIEYVQTANLRLDFWIMIKTAMLFIRRKSGRGGNRAS